MKELQAVNQQVILEISEWEQEQRTASGIIIPDSAKEKSRMAVISGMSVIDNPEVKIGDRVLFKPYSGNEVEFEGKKYLILPYGDILAKVVETEEIWPANSDSPFKVILAMTGDLPFFRTMLFFRKNEILKVYFIELNIWVF